MVSLSAAKTVAGISTSSARHNRDRFFMFVSPNLLTLGDAGSWTRGRLRGRLLVREELIQIAVDLEVDVHDDVNRFLATANGDIGAAGEKRRCDDQESSVKKHVISLAESFARQAQSP